MSTIPGLEMSHSKMVEHAIKWLRGIGCGVVLSEIVTQNASGEIPDAIGWKSGCSILVECKTSRSDFHADKKKIFRQYPDMGMGDWRVYMCEPDVIMPADLPDGWGLVWITSSRNNKTIYRRVHGLPASSGFWRPPLKGNKRTETSILVSALRRIQQSS